MKKPLAAVLAVAASCGALAGAPPTHAAEKAACLKPGVPTFTRQAGKTVGLLKWKRPRRLPDDIAGYRVLRDNEVIGQTKKLRMVVKVKPGSTVKLAVKIALTNGRGLNCAARIVQRLAWMPPGPTPNLVAQPTSEGVVLQWEPAPRGDGELVGYRVFRDGASLGQISERSLPVALPSLRSFTFAVAAVDTRGALGPLSNSIRVETGHDPPAVPTGLVAEAVSDREVQLRWSPSTGTRGARVSYRVMRDGVTVAQTGAPEARVGNLAPATGYTFSVLAIDSLGYTSGATPPVSVTTKAPEQASGGAHVFLLASTDASFQAFQARYRQINTVYPTYFSCVADGTFRGQDDPLITGWARLRGVKLHARMYCQRTATLNRILRTEPLRSTTIEQMASLAREHGWTGINLDFEAGAPGDRDAYSAFVRDLAARLHAQGSELSVDVSPKFHDVPNHPRSTFFDYDALSLYADRIFVMTWGIHWSGSVPGAIHEWRWAQRVADYVAARARLSKYILGFGMYGFDWPNGGGRSNPGTPLEFEDVMALAARTGATPVWDEAQQSPFFTYVDGGVRHDVWYTDARTLALRIELARAKGVGIGFWRLGREDPAIWQHPLLQPGVAWP
jgi:spore germination protein YaaH